MYEIFIKITEIVWYFGYFGIFIMTMIESTFIPIPSEVTLIPAGYLVATGKMNFFLVLFISTFGTLCGSLLNYYIAFKYGRSLLINYSKYFFLNEAKLSKIEAFFKKYGAISVFMGRLLPGIKHFISFPAGLGKMPLDSFSFYTSLGGALWSLILILLGYVVGENSEVVKMYLKEINFLLFVIAACIASYYIWKKKMSNGQKF